MNSVSSPEIGWSICCVYSGKHLYGYFKPTMCYLRYRGARIFTEYGLHFTPINIMFPDVRWQRAGRVRWQGAGRVRWQGAERVRYLAAPMLAESQLSSILRAHQHE